MAKMKKTSAKMSNKEKKPSTLIAKFRAIQSIGTEVEVPWKVLRLFPDNFTHISLSSNDISLGGDYGSLQENREALSWLIEQFGGTATWQK